eukprot:550974-Alexandrium_andersonii.AAC.1
MKKPIGWRPWQCTGRRHFGTLGVPSQSSCTARNSESLWCGAFVCLSVRRCVLPGGRVASACSVCGAARARARPAAFASAAPCGQSSTIQYKGGDVAPRTGIGCSTSHRRLAGIPAEHVYEWCSPLLRATRALCVHTCPV